MAPATRIPSFTSERFTGTPKPSQNPPWRRPWRPPATPLRLSQALLLLRPPPTRRGASASTETEPKSFQRKPFLGACEGRR